MSLLVTKLTDVNSLPAIGAKSYKSTRYYGPAMLRANGTLALSANTHYAMPITLFGRGSFDRIGVYVTAATGVNGRFGIYTDVADLPGTLIVDGGATALTASAMNTVTISQALGPGNFWLTMVTDGAATVNSHDSDFRIMKLGAGNLNVTGARVSAALTYGALPTSFGTPTLTESGTNITLALRAA